MSRARFATVIALLSGLTAPAFPQVREHLVPFDSAGRVMIVSSALADSVGLRQPAWPVTGAWADARLFKQDDAGYIVVVRRLEESLERYPISLEQLASIRALFDSAVPAVAAQPAEPVEELLTPAPPPSREPRSGGRFFANGQVLLATAVYGPGLGHAVRAGIDDPLAYYGAWLGTIGATLYLVRRSPERVTFSQGVLSNHAGLHGAAIGAALGFIASGGPSKDDADAVYGSAVFAGGVGGAVAGYLAGRRMTPAEATASAFAADVGLLLGVASVSSRSRFGGRFDNSAAGTLIGTTLAGYLVGPFYPKWTSETVTAGDVISLAATGVTGLLLAGAITSASRDSVERTANMLAAGMLAGIAVGHPLLVRHADHSVSEGSITVAAALGGAYIGAQIGAIGNDSSAARVLAVASIGAGAATWLIERRWAMDRPQVSRSRIGEVPGRRRVSPSIDVVGGALAAAHAPGAHTLLRVTF